MCLLMAAMASGACYSWEDVPGADALPGVEAGVRVILQDGTRVTLKRFDLRSDSVFVASGQCRPDGVSAGTAERTWCSGIAMAVDDIWRVHVRVVHRRASAALVLLCGLVGMALLVALLEVGTGRM